MPHNQRGGRTLIAYATKSGVTGETAAIIAEVLRDRFHYNVDVVDLKENPKPPIHEYKNIFIGSGIRMGRWYKQAKKLLEHEYENQNIIVFLSACSAGDLEKHDTAVKQYIDDVLQKYPRIRIVASQAFGGRMKMLGKTIEDNCDVDKVRAWAVEIGEKLQAE
jgi:menaquinone-dependent protoporphyrinogen IX oxidase